MGCHDDAVPAGLWPANQRYDSSAALQFRGVCGPRVRVKPRVYMYIVIFFIFHRLLYGVVSIIFFIFHRLFYGVVSIIR